MFWQEKQRNQVYAAKEAFSSFQWMWVTFIILTWIHLQGWLTGSGPSDPDWDRAADG